MIMKLFVITGTPGTGKSTIAGKVAGQLRGAELVHVNDVVRRRKLYSSYSRDGAMIVKMGKLRLELERIIRRSRSRTLILEGHILCELRIRNATAIVIREHLDALMGRLKKRGYSAKKIQDNIVSEATDYCGIHALSNYSAVFEVKGGSGATGRIIRIIKSGTGSREQIELLPELEKILSKNRKFVS